MRTRWSRWLSKQWAIGTILIVTVLVGVTWTYLGLYHLLNPEAKSIQTARVRKVPWLTTVVNTSGTVESVNNTEIRCSLERVGGAGGGASGSEGASTIISIVPNGTSVKKGELLCELDASAYTELVRRQLIGVDKAQAECLQAELQLSVAQIGLQSYLEGEVKQSEQAFKGQIALMKANLGRQSDRLDWSKRMYDKGYVALSSYKAEQQELLVQRMGLEQAEISFENFRRFTVPKEMRRLQSDVEGARSTVSFQKTRLKLEQDRLALYQRQVDHCKIHAPYDAFVVYARGRGRDPEVFEGAAVRQRQTLFKLPDMSQMEVQTMIHETVVNMVRPGMPARVGLEALPGKYAQGKLVSITQLPLTDTSREASGELKYYIGVVELERQPSGMRPGMSAEVEITAAHRSSVLVVPKRAIARYRGRQVCYVLTDERIERREVKLGQRTTDDLEVLDGLESGELVSLEPARSARMLEEAIAAGDQLVSAESQATSDTTRALR